MTVAIKYFSGLIGIREYRLLFGLNSLGLALVWLVIGCGSLFYTHGNTIHFQGCIGVLGGVAGVALILASANTLALVADIGETGFQALSFYGFKTGSYLLLGLVRALAPSIAGSFAASLLISTDLPGYAQVSAAFGSSLLLTTAFLPAYGALFSAWHSRARLHHREVCAPEVAGALRFLLRANLSPFYLTS